MSTLRFISPPPGLRSALLLVALLASTVACAQTIGLNQTVIAEFNSAAEFQTLANAGWIFRAGDGTGTQSCATPGNINACGFGFFADGAQGVARGLAAGNTRGRWLITQRFNFGITAMLNLRADRSQIICGVDDLMLENVLFGAVGWVSGLTNTFPRESVEMYRLATSGKTKEALELYRWFMPLLHLDVAVKLVQYIKLANQVAGEGKEWVRPPRLPLVGEERKRIEDLVNAAIANRPKFAKAA